MSVTLRLHEFLEANGISAYRLEQELKGQLTRNSVYALAKKDGVRRVDLDSLDKVVSVLNAVLGRSVSLTELFEVNPPVHELRRTASGHHYTGHKATDLTLDAYPDLDERLAAAKAML